LVAVANDPRSAVERAVRELLRVLAKLPVPPTVRVAEVDGRVACLIQVWDARRLMPTAGAERKRRASGGRTECKADIVEVVKAAGQAITRKEIVRALKSAGKTHGPSTVAKALADLTTAGAGEPEGQEGLPPRRVEEGPDAEPIRLGSVW
jgi:hypothetical protein